jgi:membrane protein required for colicin V production
MNPVDIFFVVVVLVSIITGLFRGFVREVASIAGWLAAAYLVINFSHELGHRLPLGGTAEGARTAAAAILIVVACTLCASLIGRLLRAAMTSAKLGGSDRVLGGLVGALRAVAMCMLLAVIALHLGAARERIWTSSIAAQSLEAALRFVSPGIVPASNRPPSATGV